MPFRKMMMSIPIFLCAGLLVTAGPTASHAASHSANQSVAQQEGATAKGKILGKSNKARTITIKDKELGTVMIKFTDDTEGIEHAQKGEAAIIKFTVADGDKIATVIKPKLAKLPPGVIEITPDDLAGIIAGGGDYMLIDSRPANPYNAGHIANAISMPVEKFKKEGATLLAQDNKDKLLIFYCGGPT
ncbi:MAG: rhodanese-like domain-containing protein [Desulfurivibrionaceae bacterium]|nr:rhodanese-like domain-containing protein [Desulfobulbales bacterium]MDT8334314.1 rhodanese-like domain-containing protein [Desulfurivibrionaceae bacterium]